MKKRFSQSPARVFGKKWQMFILIQGNCDRDSTTTRDTASCAKPILTLPVSLRKLSSQSPAQVNAQALQLNKKEALSPVCSTAAKAPDLGAAAMEATPVAEVCLTATVIHHEPDQLCTLFILPAHPTWERNIGRSRTSKFAR